MVDINPAALSRPAIGLSTPILSSKTINVSVPSVQKPKTSQLIPARIDLEPIYAALKLSIGPEGWAIYKESTTQFLIGPPLLPPPPCHGAFSPLALSLPLTPSLSVGRLNQAEFSERIDPLLASPDGHKERLHNQLIAAIYGNVTREMPDQGLAPWVSANDKPSTTTGSKPVSGDAAERRLKGEVMQLPSRDRRRLKDLALNDVRRPRWASIPLGRWLTCCQYDPYESLAGAFADASRLKIARTHDIPASAGGLNRMSMWSRLWERERPRC